MPASFKIFFSHKTCDAKHVCKLKERLVNRLPKFSFDDVSTAVPNSDEWKHVATSILKDCDMLVCIVGEETHSSEPIDWEIREAHRFNKPIIVAIMNAGFLLPPACKDLNIKSILWNEKEVAEQIIEIFIPRALFFGHDWDSGVPQIETISLQYNLMVQSWEALIARRQQVNTIYIAANSALLAAIGLLISSSDKVGINWIAVFVMIISLLGIAVCRNWQFTIISYGTLSKAKSDIVNAFESCMPAQMFAVEWRVLETKAYRSTTEMDLKTAKFFDWLFLGLLIISVIIIISPWLLLTIQTATNT
jgi:hypothetical protein